MKRKKEAKRLARLILEEHIVKLIKKLENKAKSKTIEKIVKKIKPKQIISKKKDTRKNIKDSYTTFAKTEYQSLEKASIYQQLIINPFIGFIYKSNIQENKDFYAHLTSELTTTDLLGEKNLAPSEMMDNYARKLTLNFLFGADVNDISVEEKERMMFNLYDRTQNILYLAKLSYLGFGTEKTMHAPVMDKAA